MSANDQGQGPARPEATDAPADKAAMDSIDATAGEKRKPPMETLKELTHLGLSAEAAKELVTAEMAREMFGQDWKLAKIFAWSGMFAELKAGSELQMISIAMAKIQLGRNWGLSPSDAMQFVYFTNGRPAIMQEIIAAKIRDAGYDWDIEWLEDAKGKCEGCVLWPKKWDVKSQSFEPLMTKHWRADKQDWYREQVKVSFTRADADTAMIWEKGKQIKLSEKWNFQSWPRDMYFWRAIARFKRYHVTNVLTGALSVDEARELPPIVPPAWTEIPTLRPVAPDNRNPSQAPAYPTNASGERMAPRGSDVLVTGQPVEENKQPAGNGAPPETPPAANPKPPEPKATAAAPAPAAAAPQPAPKPTPIRRGLTQEALNDDQWKYAQSVLQRKKMNRLQIEAFLARHTDVQKCMEEINAIQGELDTSPSAGGQGKLGL